MSKAQVSRWHKEFKDGRETVEDKDRSGRPSTSSSDENVSKVKELLESDHRLSLRLIAEELNMCKSTVHNIVTENLNMRKVCAKLVPKVLSDEQKQRRVDVCREMVEVVEGEADFFLFPKLKTALKGRRFDDFAAIQKAVTNSLKGISEADFQGAYESWKSRWQRCIDAQGDYFEEF